MPDQVDKANFGIAGLDDITVGGLARGRLFLAEGSPGTGKTTIATQFLLAGAAVGEPSLYITLSETEDELRAGAASHGWLLDGIDIFELVPPESLLDEDQQQSLLYSSDLELGETTRRIFELFEKVKPKRVVLDSLSEIRLLAQSSLRYRRQILALKHYFARSGATVLMLDDLSSEANDRTMHSVAHGVIRLEELSLNMAPNVADCAFSNIGGSDIEAVIMISSSTPVACVYFQGSYRQNIASRSSARCSRPNRPN